MVLLSWPMCADGVFMLPDLTLGTEAKRIGDLAPAAKLPTMSWGGWYARAVCLMSYAADYGQMNRQLAYDVDRISRGAEPGDLPLSIVDRPQEAKSLASSQALWR